MTDHYQVYRKVLKVLKGMMKLSHPGYLVTLAMLIAGIVVSRHAQLSRISGEPLLQPKIKALRCGLDAGSRTST
ncbi:MAG TPA: hypothetical protein PK832_14160 [Anaerolineae bacterium]|nr:hypothetical protein [Anaerolineae bacterium]